MDERERDVGIGMSARHMPAVGDDRAGRVKHDMTRMQRCVQKPVARGKRVQLGEELGLRGDIKVGLFHRTEQMELDVGQFFGCR